MTPPKFIPLSTQHWSAVIAVLVATASVTWLGRAATPVAAERGGRILGVVLVAYYFVESFIRVRLVHVTWLDVLPFDLCSALFFVGAYAYWFRSALAFELVYFWTFAGTIHALITPTPTAGFPDVSYFQYFAAHGLLTLTAVYSIAVLGRRPQPGGARRAFLALQLFTALVVAVDFLTAKNFMFLRSKPPYHTVLDAMGPWPFYILGGEALAVVSFFAWSVPFLLKDGRVRSRQG